MKKLILAATMAITLGMTAIAESHDGSHRFSRMVAA